MSEEEIKSSFAMNDEEHAARAESGEGRPVPPRDPHAPVVPPPRGSSPDMSRQRFLSLVLDAGVFGNEPSLPAADLEELPSFRATRAELRVLARHWAGVRMNLIKGRYSGSYEHLLDCHVASRLRHLASAMGQEDLQAVVTDEVEGRS